MQDRAKCLSNLTVGHRRRDLLSPPVRHLPAPPLSLSVSWFPSCCQAAALWSEERACEHLIIWQSATTRCRPREVTGVRVHCAPRVHAKRLTHVPAATPMGRPGIMMAREGHSTAAKSASRSWATRRFRPSGIVLNRIPFLFRSGLNSSLNLKKSYLPIQSSKNHETSSVGFKNSRSIH
jgi:hypothetical protein